MFTVKTISVLALGALAMLQPAMALQPRSWVSSSGVDTNPCTQDKPCRTFQQAVLATQSGGEVNAIDAADYGIVTIDRSLTLDGGGKGYITQPLSSDSILINNPSAVVIIRNLSMIGFSQGESGQIGIHGQAVRMLSVDNVSLKGFYNAIYIGYNDRGPTKVVVKDSYMRNCGSGILTVGNSAAELTQRMSLVADNVTIEGSVDGMSLAYTRAVVTRSNISDTTNAGIFAIASEVNVSDSTIAFCNRGLTVSTNAFFRLSGNNIHDNVLAFLFAGGSFFSYGNNSINGNGGTETPTATITLK